MWVDYSLVDYDLRKQPFNERLVEMIRGKRDNIFGVVYDDPKTIPDNPLCVQYNYRQRAKASYGIAFYNTRTKKWFVVEPYTTIEMRMLVQGYYTVNTIPFMVEQLFDSELDLIISYHRGRFWEFYSKVYGVDQVEKNGLIDKIWDMNIGVISEVAKRIKAYRMQKGVRESQYIFPKGRPCDSESYFSTAVREVEEESKIKILFENPDVSMRQLSRQHVFNDTASNLGTSPSTYIDVVNNKPAETHVKQSCWEHCRVVIPDHEPPIEAFICKEYISHSHSDIMGKIYKTTLWICVFDAPEIEDAVITKSNETRMGRWVTEEVLRTRFRVRELYLKCEGTLNRYYPYLTL